MGISIRKRITAVAPQWIVRAYRKRGIRSEFLRDYRDYVASTAWRRGAVSRDARRDPQESARARLTLAYHGLEKGPTVPNPHRPFGVQKRVQVEQWLGVTEALGASPEAAEHARDAINAMEAFNKTGIISDIVSPRSSWDGRRVPLDRLEQFMTSRNSVRNFDPDRTLPVDEVHSAVKLAGACTPSVCNRRAYRAHYYARRDQIDAALALQNGNRGFGSTVPGLLIVTERRSAFVGAGERNQRWVDGGLFAMTLVWTLHAFGMGTCFLNWSQTNQQSDRLRTAVGIPEDEDIIVLIALGYPSADHRVARSPERLLSDVLVTHDEAL